MSEKPLDFSDLVTPDGPLAFDDLVGSSPKDLEKGRISSAAATIERGISEGMADVVKGAVRAANPNTALYGMGFGVMPSPGMIETARKWNETPGDEKQKQIAATEPYAGAERFAQAGRENYRPNPVYDREWFASRIPGAFASSMIPLAVGAASGAGPAALAYALQSGQQGAQEAVDAGNPDAADKAFLGYALAGGVSEGLLGAGANIWRYVRAARRAGVEPGKFRGWLQIAAKGAGREAAQEGIEQVGQNIVFDQTVAPRPWMKDVPESALLGGIVGGGFAGAGAAVGMRGQPRPPAEPQIEEQLDELPAPEAVQEPQVTAEQAQLAEINRGLQQANDAIEYSPMDMGGGDPQARSRTPESSQIEPVESVQTPDVPIDFSDFDTAGGNPDAIPSEPESSTFEGGEANGQEVQRQEAVRDQAAPSPNAPAGTESVQGEGGLTPEQSPETKAAEIGLLNGTVVQRESGGAGVSQETTRPDPAGSITIPGSGQPTQQRQPGRADPRRFPEQPGKPPGQATPAEDAVNQAIDRLKIKGGGLMEGVTGLPVWLWNGSLDAVKLTYQATKSLANAISAGLEWIRKQAPAVQFDEGQYRQAVERSLGIREHGQKVLAADDLTSGIKGQVTNLLYQRHTNEGDAEFAARIMRQVGGPERAVAVFTDETSGLPQSVRTMLGMEISKAISAQSIEAQASGNAAEAERLNTLAARFLDDHFLPYTTSLGQGLQALNAWFGLTAAGKVVWARMNLQRQAAKLLNRIRPDVDQAVRELQEIQRQAGSATARQAKVQDAARAAIDSAVERDARTPGTQVHNVLAAEAAQAAANATAPAKMADGFWTRLLMRDEYWAKIARGSTRSLESALGSALRSNQQTEAENQATVDGFAARLTAVLRQQINQALRATPQAPAGRPNYLAQLRELVTNAERMAQIWGAVREQVLEQYRGNPQVEQVMTQPFDVWSKPLLKSVLNQWLREQGVSLRELVRGHYQLPQGQLAAKLVESLGLDERTAKRLSSEFDRVYQEAMAKGIGRVQAAAQRVRRDPALIRLMRAGVVSVESIPDSELALAVAGAISRRRVAMGKLVREHGAQLDAVGVDLANQLVAEAGLSGDEAAKFANLVRVEVNRQAGEKRRRVLERMLKPAKAIGIVRPGALDKLLAAANLGALSQERFWNALRERLDLPTWSPKLAAEMTQLADEIQRIPADQMERRQVAMQRFHNALERAKGIDPAELTLAYWMANILTGPATHAVNVLSTGLNSAGAVSSEIARAVLRGRPGDIVLILEALAKGVGPGIKGAGRVLATGMVTGTRLKKVEPARVFELTTSADSALRRAISVLKYNYRLMAAEDMMFFKPLEEMKAAMLALQLARSLKISGQDARVEARRILGYGAEQVARADAQAAAEGFTGTEAKRRAAEILQQNRGQTITETAAEYARRNTFNSEPYGILGAAARAMNDLKGHEDGRIRIAANVVVPFTNIISNVVNENLNWGAIGWARAARVGSSANPLGLKAESLTPAQKADLRAELLAKATLGTALLAALGLRAAMFLDDDDPEFAIYGSGPRQPSDRAGMDAAGWKPHTLKIGGVYLSFANSPAAIYLDMLGNWFDLHRDARKLGNKDAQRVLESAPDAIAASAAQGIRVITEQSFLSSLMQIAEAVGNPQPSQAGKGMMKFAARVAGGFVPASGLLSQVDRTFDPARRETKEAETIITGAIPFVRRMNRPSLDALGRPIESSPVQRFGSVSKDDALVQALAQRGLWPEIPDRNQVYRRKGRAMDDDEFYAYHRDSGALILQRLQYFRPAWDVSDRERAAKRVAEIVSDARAQVRRRMGF